MSANPSLDLNLDEEIRNVQMAIQSFSKKDSVELIHRPATRLMDMINILNLEKPHILHFAGHGGAKEGELKLINDETGNAQLISNNVLLKLFQTVKNDNLKLVFLNSCYSKDQSGAILESIDYIIGMNSKIGNNTARTLSTQFYSSFVSGVSLVNSFGQAEVALMANHPSQQSVPELLTRNNDVKDFSIEDIIGKEEPQLAKEENTKKGQSHTGSGDNVAGNKVIHTTNKTIHAEKNYEKIDNNGGTMTFN